MKRLIFLLPFLLFSNNFFCTDISKIKFEYVTVDDGLSQGTIEDILQDKQGFMWFATRDGLNKYDGQKFVIYRNDSKDANSLASNWVLSLAQDPKGNLWIGSIGLNVYDPVLDKMTRIPVDIKNDKAFHGGQVFDISVDFDSTLWISTSNGLVHYSPAKNVFKTYTSDLKESSVFASNTIYSTIITRDNKLFVAVEADPIYVFNRSDGTFKELNYKLSYAGANYDKNIQEDSNGLLYIVSENSGVHIYNPATQESKLIDVSEGGLNAVSVKTKVLQVGPDEIWIGTDGGGINIYHPLSGVMQYLTPDSKNANSLNNKAVFKLYQDRDMNIWVGHFNTGISVWKKNKEKFTSFHHNPFNPFTINKEVVCAIFEDSKGRIWVGQDGGGLNLFHEENQSFEHFRHETGNPESLTTDVILTIHEDTDGNLLLGTYSGGLMIFDPDKKKVIKAFNAQDGLPSLHIWTIYRDSKDRYWLALLRSGVSLYNPANRSFVHYTTEDKDHNVSSNMVMYIAEDKKGRLWFGTENQGICVLDLENNKVKIYTHDEKNANTLSHNDVKSIVFVDNYAWIATNGGGLNRLDLSTDSIKVYTMEDGLSSNALMAMLRDKQNNLWISSTRGLMKFNLANGAIEIYDKSQGIQGTEFKYNAECQLSDGRMMFGGVDGLTVFHPDSIRNSNIIPSVVFTDFKIFNESVVPSDKGSLLQKHINFTDQIVLKHNQSVFTIEFASLDYNAPQKNRYMYKLEGFDENWIDAGNRSFVTYTNLDAGKYTFLLKGSNSDGVFNETPRKLMIRIRPPWYRTIFALTLFFLALVSFIFYYIRQREQQSLHDKKVLRQKIEESQEALRIKITELERQSEELRMRDEQEKDMRFITEGVAKFSDIISKKRRNLEELVTSLVSEMVRYTDASAGEIYIADSAGTDILLRATGGYAVGDDNEHLIFESGEGYVGTCFKEKTNLRLDNLPDTFKVLRSGLGAVSLQHAIFIPVMQDQTCVGVIEIASIEKLSNVKVEFVEKVAESLASVIIIIKANEQTNRMLEQNNLQAEELKAQEEEMRQNIEELRATQEISSRRETEIRAALVAKTSQLEILQKEFNLLKRKLT